MNQIQSGQMRRQSRALYTLTEAPKGIALGGL